MSVGTTYGKYFLLKKLASGGMGEIFLARQQGPEGFEKVVVIKRILSHLTDNDEYLQLFKQEARLQARMNNSSIVQIFDFNQADDGSWFVAMEYVHGKSLVEILGRLRQLGERLPATLVASIFERAADGLSYAHNMTDNAGRSLNIIHRDISPHNVLISYQGDVKLIDFGIAKSEINQVKTETGTIKGKFYYMSPEQSAAEKLDQRSDIFSLGIVLYECLVGDNPFVRPNVVMSLEAIQKLNPPLPSTVDPALAPFDPIIERVLAKDREQRYPDASELKEDLARARMQLPASKEKLGHFLQKLFKDKFEEECKVLQDTDASSLDVLQGTHQNTPSKPSRIVSSPTDSNPRAVVEVEDVDTAGTRIRGNTGEKRAAAGGNTGERRAVGQTGRARTTTGERIAAQETFIKQPGLPERRHPDPEAANATGPMPAERRRNGASKHAAESVEAAPGVGEEAPAADAEADQATEERPRTAAEEELKITPPNRTGLWIGLGLAGLVLLGGGWFMASRRGPPAEATVARTGPERPAGKTDEPDKADDTEKAGTAAGAGQGGTEATADKARAEAEAKADEARKAEEEAARKAAADEAARKAATDEAKAKAQAVEAARQAAADEARAKADAEAQRKAELEAKRQAAAEADAARRKAEEARKAQLASANKSALIGTLLIHSTPAASLRVNGKPVSGVKADLTGASGTIDVVGEESPFKIRLGYRSTGVEVSCEPWAIVYVDGLSKGKTPVQVPWSEGTVQLELKRPGLEQTARLKLRYSKP